MRACGIIAVIVLVTPLLVIVVLAYIFHVNVPGLTGKNLWDWLQLLIIPAVLAIGGYLFNFATSRTEREISLDKQREDALQAYIDSMSELLLKEHLHELISQYDNARQVARVRTLTVLPRLDPVRKANVLRFLYEANLIDREHTVVDLAGADLRGAHLHEADLLTANLSKTNLSGADLSHAVLSQASLREANLGRANLHRAILSRTDFTDADFTNANLGEAHVSPTYLSYKHIEERLKVAKSLKGAIMPLNNKHD